MKTIYATSVSEALQSGLTHLLMTGVEEPSRAGPVLVSQLPVCTEYVAPRNRVLFSPVRDANPFFHLMEALWMLAGRRDVAFVQQYNSQIAKYSDDGLHFHGAYGHRWRSHFGADQLTLIADELIRNPSSRRCVLTMWDPIVDLAMAGNDFPCNTQIYFMMRRGELTMTVCNRSNDAIWGAYGANAVHFSMLHEYMAALVGVPMGTYWQISNNLHAYLDKYTRQEMREMAWDAGLVDEYLRGIGGHPLVNGPIDVWHNDLANFVNSEPGTGPYETNFFARVAEPMRMAYLAYKIKDFATAKNLALTVAAADWRVAGLEWLQRRESAALRTALPGSGGNAPRLRPSEGATAGLSTPTRTPIPGRVPERLNQGELPND